MSAASWSHGQGKVQVTTLKAHWAPQMLKQLQAGDGTEGEAVVSGYCLAAHHDECDELFLSAWFLIKCGLLLGTAYLQ
mgnify:CR=1 FL=1